MHVKRKWKETQEPSVGPRASAPRYVTATSHDDVRGGGDGRRRRWGSRHHHWLPYVRDFQIWNTLSIHKSNESLARPLVRAHDPAEESVSLCATAATNRSTSDHKRFKPHIDYFFGASAVRSRST